MSLSKLISKRLLSGAIATALVLSTLSVVPSAMAASKLSSTRRRTVSIKTSSVTTGGDDTGSGETGSGDTGSGDTGSGETGSGEEEAKSIVITFIAGENGSLKGGDQNITIKEGDSITKVPTPIGNKGYTFECWQTEDEKPVTFDDLVVKDDMTLKAIFAEDLNGDKIPDKEQNVYTIEFTSDEVGSLEGTTKFTFIGGKKDDGQALKLTDVVGTFEIPSAAGKTSEASFDKWELTEPASATATATAAVVALLNGNLQIKEDMTFNATYTLKDYKITFINTSKVVATIKGVKGDAIDGTGTAITDPVGTKATFQGWICPDGALRSSSDVAKMNITGNMTFTAKFASKLSIGRR